MSRRAPNPAAERTAQNSTTVKSLLKLEGNKTCADCKRNKHPRWASWNLGIFICIRCSGIHRGMGTHISRVKSVELDAWTDEQVQSVVRWGNTKANKYWEAKLAPGHVPSEAKIENFIRTKYESKRWVMDGPMPDPSTLDDEADDDIPLSVIQEKQKLERSASTRASSGNPPHQVDEKPQDVDLFGDNSTFPAPRPATTTPSGTRPPPPKAAAGSAKQTKPADSLLGLDFFGVPAPPGRPSSASANPQSTSTQSRPDLKQSILSLYASAPRQQSQPQSQHSQGGSITGMQSSQNQQQHPQHSTFGGLNDAFSGLGFTPTKTPAAPATQAPQSKPSAFANLGNISSNRPGPTQMSSSSTITGGGFFGTPTVKPIQASKPPPSLASRTFRSSGFGAFDSALGASPTVSSTPSSGLGDLFDFSTPSAPPAQPVKQPTASPTNHSSVFNLSAAPAVTSPPQQRSQPSNTVTAPTSFSTGWSNTDAWGSNDAWATADSTTSNTAAPSKKSPAPLPPVVSPANDFSWGSNTRTTGNSGAQSPPATKNVTADEDFGGWSSSSGARTASAIAPPPSNVQKGASFGGSDDLFSNVWE